MSGTIDDPQVLADRAAMHQQFLADRADQDDRTQLTEQVKAALTLLDGTATTAQMRVILARLIRYLVRTGAIG